MTIFELVKSQEIAAYWDTLAQEREPYIGEELFPDQKKLGISLKWIKGSKGLPAVLKTSGFDVNAIPRARIGFDKLSAEMPFFKESVYIDEELRQELNMVIETGNQAYIDSVLNRVFDEPTGLVESAAVSRERMRMQLLTSGTVAMSNNGQVFLFDYGVPDNHKVDASVAWSDYDDSDPIEDLRTAQDAVEEDTGVRPTRGICNRQAWGYLLKNEIIKKNIYVLTNGVGFINDARLRAYLLDELGLDLVVNDKRYKNEAGVPTKYVEDGVVTLFPVGTLGNTWFGTTPEESDLMASAVANVSIVDTGVAITTMEETDPVQVNTKVTQICLPSFESADHIAILDINPS